MKPGDAPIGCPAGDLDGDDVANELDECPYEPGVAPDGCPVPDDDGDGVLDERDACPKRVGVAPHGCPAGDGDGVSDVDDKCPFTFGEQSNGCHDCSYCDVGLPSQGAPKFKSVRFERATTLASTARKNLDDAVEVMNSYHLRIELSGHADDLEKDAAALSLRRARVVYRHLVKRGVDKKRVRFRGAGASEPIGDNETEEGRAKNRRVDITIIIH